MSGSGVMESTGQTLASAHPVEQEGVARLLSPTRQTVHLYCK